MGLTLHLLGPTEVILDGAPAAGFHEELEQLAHDKGMHGWLALGTCYRGAALAMRGQIQEGLAVTREGIAACQSTGARVALSGPLCSLAEAQVQAGHPEAGLATLAEVLSLVEGTEEHSWGEPYRLKGESLLLQGDKVQAEAGLQAESCFQHAIQIARHQQARSWELRATTSLARLWQVPGRTDEARKVLAEIYGWFTEGFDTADLREAKTLLGELSS